MDHDCLREIHCEGTRLPGFDSRGHRPVEQARGEVLPFVRNPEALDLWSREFFLDVVRRVRCVQEMEVERFAGGAGRRKGLSRKRPGPF
jgi:hypothetical protein